MNSNEIGLLIKGKRKMYRLTQAKLSTELGYKWSVVSEWENGSRKITFDDWEKIKEALKLTDEDIAYCRHELVKDLSTLAPKKERDKFNKEMGKRLKNLRTERGLTQAEVAFEIGIERVNYVLVENGKARLTISQLREARSLFATTYEYLLDGLVDDEKTMGKVIAEADELRKELAVVKARLLRQAKNISV